MIRGDLAGDHARPWVETVSPEWLDAVHGGPGPGGLPPGVIDFSVNVNPFGPAPLAAEAWKRADPTAYPDPSSLAVREAAAALWHVPEASVRFGAGATEFLHRAVLAWLEPGGVGVVPEPCFAEYGRAIALARGRVVRVPPSDGDGTLDLDVAAETARRHRAGLIYLGRPNTPTGESVATEALARFREELPPGCLLVLDESFLSFGAATVSAPPVLGVREGVLSVRSITKDCALAGLRAGFAVAPEPVLRALDRVALPWTASAPAQLAARASLQPESVHFLDETLARTRTELDRMHAALVGMGLRPRPSRANFLCVRVPAAASVADALDEIGLRVRRCASFELPSHLRFGVRRPEDNTRLIDALEAMGPFPGRGGTPCV